jgi:hypothetical protein
MLKVAIERVDLAVETVQVHEHLLERQLRQRVLEALAGNPLAIAQRPVLLAVPVDPPVTQQLLEHPLPRGCARAAQITPGSASDP